MSKSGKYFDNVHRQKTYFHFQPEYNVTYTFIIVMKLYLEFLRKPVLFLESNVVKDLVIEKSYLIMYTISNILSCPVLRNFWFLMIPCYYVLIWPLHIYVWSKCCLNLMIYVNLVIQKSYPPIKTKRPQKGFLSKNLRTLRVKIKRLLIMSRNLRFRVDLYSIKQCFGSFLIRIRILGSVFDDYGSGYF